MISRRSFGTILLGLCASTLPLRLNVAGIPRLAAIRAEARNGGGNGGGQGNGGGNGRGGGGGNGGNSGGGNGGGQGNGGGNGRGGGGNAGGKGGNSSGGKGGAKGGASKGGNAGKKAGAPANGSPAASAGSRKSSIRVVHRNGMREKIENGRYEMTDGKGRRIIERRATGADAARLRRLDR